MRASSASVVAEITERSGGGAHDAQGAKGVRKKSSWKLEGGEDVLALGMDVSARQGTRYREAERERA